MNKGAVTIIGGLTDDVATRLIAGEVGVIPTDTVYGLACRAADRQAVARLYALKSREHKPGTVIAASVEQLEALSIKRRYISAIAGLWPNPISIVLPDSHELQYLDQGLQSLAVRVPSYSELHDLLLKTGPLLTTSANLPGEPPAVNITEAQDYFADGVDFYSDIGELKDTLPSTVVKVIDDELVVLRQGQISLDEINRLLN